MRPQCRRIGIIAALGVVFCAGCLRHLETKPGGESPLNPLVSAPESVTLDIVTLLYVEPDDVVERQLWQRVDEQHISADLRRQLLANGFRVGVLGSQLPPELEQRLRMTDKPLSAETQLTAVELSNDSPVRQRSLQVQAGHRTNILCLGEQQKLPELSLLMRDESGAVAGKTYRKVLGQFAARAYPEGDGRARLELVPELEHGDPQRRYDPSEGMLRVDFGPARESLESLKIVATLAPGQLLVIASSPDRPGSLGRHFFTTTGGDKKRQKLLLVRLGRTSSEDSFHDGTLPAIGDTAVR